jgi:hypothetical protein
VREPKAPRHRGVGAPIEIVELPSEEVRREDWFGGAHAREI